MQAFRKLLCSFTLLLVSQQIIAQGPCEHWLGKLASAQGQVEIRRAGTSIWRPVIRGERYCDMDAIRTGRNSRAVLLLNTNPSNRTLTNVNQNTFLTFKSLGNEPSAFDLMIDLLKGGALFRSRQPNRLDIDTPFVNAVHKGTEFLVRVDADQTLVSVYDGQVATSNAEGKLTVDKGETALAKRGKAPVQYALVRPRDAVQWALNYPPVIDYQAASSTPYHPAIGDALSAYRRGDLIEALAILDKVPEAQREPNYYTTKAGLLLSVGRVDEATPAIEKALTQDSKNATAFALKSVIAVAQNRNDKAMQLAERAAQLDPKSPTPQVALSYAHQSEFELEKALESAEKAVELGPGNAPAFSRFSELTLSMGDLDEALEAAEKATALDPDLARTQTVLGFAYLTKIDIDEARQTFEKAIALDQAAPLPRLGLGLAKIREGELKNGTDEIEIAASLDPDNSLIRSYLGKAFYEKKENLLAGTELEIAKELDPNDPTPWFYDAIRKQTTNRPVEALHDMQKAIELNDNRAVYRSRLLLDDDSAARSAALARIYNDLGFQQRGLVEGWKSVNTDPSNYSAHRLLADNYAALPRHEIARVSELLQSQLLQPINVTPVQPNLGESNLLILDGSGPSSSSFNEFNPLFKRNRFALQASGVFGNNDTLGDEVTQSGLWNKLSYSLGQFHFETNGFRENNDFDVNIYNAFVQANILPKLNVQAEFRRREVESGNFDSLFAPTEFDLDFVQNIREELNSDTYRVGLHVAPTKRSDLLASLIYLDEDAKSRFRNDPAQILNSNGFLAETQYLYQWEIFNTIFGGGYYRLNQSVAEDESSEKARTEHGSVYSYSQIHFPTSVAWTLGLSGDTFDSDVLPKTITRVNPKFGVLWNITQDTVFRAAYFKALKRSLVANRTLEPTQVAGFNQFFDDFNGTRSERWGLGIDHRFSPLLAGGVEISERDLLIPIGTENIEEDRWEESFYRAYLQFTPHPRWAVVIEYSRENFDNLESFGPLDTETQIIPFRVSYFDPSGLFTKFRVSYLDQEVALETGNESDSETFLDLSVGYRLPRRWGIFEVQLQNLLDRDYRYEGLQNRRPPQRIGLPSSLPFPPELTISARLTLAF